MNRKKIYFSILLVILLFPLTSTSAMEVQQVETSGVIEFTGTYEPIGKPDPPPTESIVGTTMTELVKPEGMFPQTNDSGSSRFLLLGILAISLVFLLWKRKNKQIQN
ncbi:LPXTG cell wall anchor domain-containing protein [Enterococcus casseliflavus]|uniref:LPXTG cell wall anchor domain-containing protein n=1 Tax=Enterococcus casseliflavus TaxID=37734 RepID=UPI003EDE98BE